MRCRSPTTGQLIGQAALRVMQVLTVRWDSRLTDLCSPPRQHTLACLVRWDGRATALRPPPQAHMNAVGQVVGEQKRPRHRPNRSIRLKQAPHQGKQFRARIAQISRNFRATFEQIKRSSARICPKRRLEIRAMPGRVGSGRVQVGLCLVMVVPCRVGQVQGLAGLGLVVLGRVATPLCVGGKDEIC